MISYGKHGIGRYIGATKHVAELPPGVEHGSMVVYGVYGCRCDKCESANAKERMKWRKHN